MSHLGKYTITLPYNGKLHLGLLSNGVLVRGTKNELIFIFDSLNNFQGQIIINYLLNDSE